MFVRNFHYTHKPDMEDNTVSHLPIIRYVPGAHEVLNIFAQAMICLNFGFLTTF